MKRSTKILLTLGSVSAVIGVMIIVLADNYSLGSKFFAAGYLVVVMYAVGGTLTASSESIPKVSQFGWKTAAFGFGLGAIAFTISVFFPEEGDSNLKVFVDIGVVLVVAGLLVHLFSLIRGKSNGV